MSEQYSQLYGVEDPPAVDVVRFVDSDEKQEAFEACLLEEGFEKREDGGYRVSESQRKVFNLASYTCEMKYPLPKQFAEPWGEEQIEAQYAWTKEFLVPCLEAEGYPVRDIPSKTTFIDTWDSDPFRPFAQVHPRVSPEQFNREWARLEESCPQEAPGAVLWGQETIREWKVRTGRR